MQISVIEGIFTDAAAEFRSALPRNMVVVPKSQGISSGYLRPAEGIVQRGTGPGLDRGGIAWNGQQYRVMGAQLVRVAADGGTTALGAIAGSGQVTFTYSFDRLAIAGGGLLYYYDGASLVQVTDPDLGPVLDVVWVDGYFMATDGASLVQTELNDPTSVNPLKYGSSEADPDPIMGVLLLRDELYAVNRYSIEQFNNIGGNLFAFQRNEGAYIGRGAIGTHAKAVYADAIAFLGGGRNEPPAVWLGLNGASQKISTREIEALLLAYTEAQLAQCVLEARNAKAHQWLYLHLPDRTLVYDAAASAVVQQPVWVELGSAVAGPGQYRARNFVWCHDAWWCADPTSPAIGVLDDRIATHYGAVVGWEFSTQIVYNASMGALFHQLELVALPGRVAFGAEPVVWASYSLDGETWSQEKPCRAGRQGERLRRLTWLANGSMANWRIQKFRGTSDAHLAVARLEAQLEPLNA
jgi:hypothetical protein